MLAVGCWHVDPAFSYIVNELVNVLYHVRSLVRLVTLVMSTNLKLRTLSTLQLSLKLERRYHVIIFIKRDHVT